MDEFKDIEGEPDAEAEQFVAESDGVPWGVLLVTAFLVMLVVFAVQNTDVVTVEFFWMNGEFPLSIVILVTTLTAQRHLSCGDSVPTQETTKSES